MSPRVLIIATTTGYQARAFGEAAVRAGIEPVFATDRCRSLDNPWRDSAVPVRFHEEAASVEAIVLSARVRPVDGVLALGDRPAILAAAAAAALGLAHHSVDSARAAGNKQVARDRFRAAGLLAPWSFTARADVDARAIASTIAYPCVVKPLTLSASRGVIRANDASEFEKAFRRVRALLEDPRVQVLRDPATHEIGVEGYIAGAEYAVEGLLDRGRLRVLTIFDKPDPLEGPFFEETIYVTPSRVPPQGRQEIEQAVGRAVTALGLTHGPVHAECRVNDQGVFVLEVAARPIGGLCAGVLRFAPRISPRASAPELPPGAPADRGSPGEGRAPLIALEELLVRHAAGEDVACWQREATASGVMMLPIPRAGVLRGVEGVEDALAVEGVEDVRITAKPDQRLVPLPEGASYLGFIFARGNRPEAVEESLRNAHARLRFTIDRPITVL